MEDMLQVGVITATHGIRGEVKVFPTTDDPARFKEAQRLVLDTGKEKLPLKVSNVRFFKQFVILKFRGYDSINEIECYRGKELYVTRENAVPLGRDEYFVADLLGMQVLDESDKEVGTLEDVIETGANDVYSVVTREGKEILLPAIKDCILDVDIQAGRMYVRILPGLLN